MSKQEPKTPKERNTLPPKPKSLLEMAMAHPLVVLISLIATLLGLVLGALSFSPRVVVSSPSGPMAFGNMFDASMDVSNAGFIPLTDVGACLIIGEIVSGPTSLRPGFRFYTDPSKQTRMCRDTWQHHDLDRDNGRFTINLTDMFSRATGADIAVVVQYYPWFLPWRREKLFRFIAMTNMSGKTDWRAWPFAEARPAN